MFVYKVGTSIMAVYTDGTRKNMLTNRIESNKTIAPYVAQIANEKGSIVFVKGAELYISTADLVTKSIGSYDGEKFLTFSGPHLLLSAGANEVRHINVLNGDDYIIEVQASSAFVIGHNIYFSDGRDVNVYDTIEYNTIESFTIPSCECCSNVVERVYQDIIYVHCWKCGANGHVSNGNYYRTTFHYFKDRPDCTISYENSTRLINYSYPVPANWKFDIIRNYLIVWNGNIYSVININA